jgi:DNA-binding transcriptional ArsR family regulator
MEFTALEQDERLDRASRCLKALAHPTRLKIIALLKDGEKSVGALEAEVGTSQSNVSQHLGLLRAKEILAARRAGNQVYYRVRDERLFTLLGLIQEVYCQD